MDDSFKSSLRKDGPVKLSTSEGIGDQWTPSCNMYVAGFTDSSCSYWSEDGYNTAWNKIFEFAVEKNVCGYFQAPVPDLVVLFSIFGNPPWLRFKFIKA